MTIPSITIVTATRNRPALLDRALASIAAQTFADFRAIVVDDGSTEENASANRATAARYGSRFHVYQPVKPGEAGSGPSVSRNRGVFAADDPYIAFLDDDDTWIWDRFLETAVHSLTREDADIFCGDMEGTQKDERLIASWFPDAQALVRASARISEDPPLYRSTPRVLLSAGAGRVIHPDMLVVSRRLVERAGGFLPSLWFGEDMEFVLRLLDHVRDVVFCGRTVARYRLPEADSLSSATNRIAQDLSVLSGAQHARMNARTPDIRNAARAIEAWTLRSLSRRAKHAGRWADAIGLAAQAMAVRPSLGGAWHLTTSLIPGAGPAGTDSGRH
jgi:glycosyltransferase involved in cell wall biosynthesis